MESKSIIQVYEVKKVVIAHHYLLTAVFFILSLITVSLYSHLLKSMTETGWIYSVIYFGGFGVVYVFTNRLYSRVNFLFKYVFLAIILFLFCTPFITQIKF